MAKRKKSEPEEGNYSNAYIEGQGVDDPEESDEQDFVLYYKDLNGVSRSMRLDARDSTNARAEAASHLGLPESEIGDG